MDDYCLCKDTYRFSRYELGIPDLCDEITANEANIRHGGLWTITMQVTVIHKLYHQQPLASCKPGLVLMTWLTRGHK